MLVDSNVLVQSVEAHSEGHADASFFMGSLLQASQPWCLTWTNVYEFLRLMTHPAVFRKPLTWVDAARLARGFVAHPNVEVLAETARHLEVLDQVARAAGGASGNFVHDCHIAALMVEHDVKHIVTGDTHFRRFGLFKVWTPREALKAR